MRISLKLGLVGFVAGGVLTCFLEWKGAAFEPATKVDAGAQRDQRRAKGDLGAGYGPRAILSHLQRAGDWLQGRSAASKRERARTTKTRARTTKASARRPGPAVRSSPEKNRRPTMWSGIQSADPSPRLRFRMQRFLVGQQVVSAGVMDESKLKTQERHGKYLVYFDLSVTNKDYRRRRFSYEDFRLQGSKGLVYTPVQPRDYLSADLRAGETVRGGVAFAIYGDSAPARLLYRTGVDSFAPVPESFFSRSHN